MPCKTDPPLFVHTDAVLSCAISSQRFQTIAPDSRQIRKRLRAIQHYQPPVGRLLDVPELPASFKIEDRFGVLAPEAADHAFMVSP